MDWTAQIDGYCERTEFGFWAEPLNALTNAGYLIVALVMWRRCAGWPMARALCAILLGIAAGSFAFHTTAAL